MCNLLLHKETVDSGMLSESTILSQHLNHQMFFILHSKFKPSFKLQALKNRFQDAFKKYGDENTF
jgi:hypothetical protein